MNKTAMFFRQRKSAVIAAVILAALFCRLIAAFCVISSPERLYRPDSDGYLAAARSLANRGAYAGDRRPPLFPLLAAGVYALHGDDRALSLVLTLFSLAAVAVTMRAAAIYAGTKAAVTAGMLLALNITAIGNAPLLLADTLFGFFVALQLLFFLKSLTTGKLSFFLISVVLAAVGTLIKPINQLWLYPALFFLATDKRFAWQQKIQTGVVSLLFFFALLFPWMQRNSLRGAGFCIDTNTGAMYHQNGAMLLAEVNGTDFETEKLKLRREQEELFRKNPRLFPNEKSREKWRMQNYRRLIMAHPLIWLKQQFNWRVLIPDLPALLEDFGITSSDRGTMGVMQKYGVCAAVKHYFGTGWLFWLILMTPLLLVTAVTYAAAFWQILSGLSAGREDRFRELLLFLLFAGYYLLLPGAICAPRYQLPALPALTILAAIPLCRWYDRHTAVIRGRGMPMSRV